VRVEYDNIVIRLQLRLVVMSPGALGKHLKVKHLKVKHDLVYSVQAGPVGKLMRCVHMRAPESLGHPGLAFSDS
jgi:hypothetical protein